MSRYTKQHEAPLIEVPAPKPECRYCRFWDQDDRQWGTCYGMVVTEDQPRLPKVKLGSHHLPMTRYDHWCSIFRHRPAEDLLERAYVELAKIQEAGVIDPKRETLLHEMRYVMGSKRYIRSGHDEQEAEIYNDGSEEVE